MEGRLGLHLQSAVTWQGESNENDTGQIWIVNRWDIHRLNNMRMNEHGDRVKLTSEMQSKCTQVHGHRTVNSYIDSIRHCY